jgi:hypothetical protein
VFVAASKYSLREEVRRIGLSSLRRRVAPEAWHSYGDFMAHLLGGTAGFCTNAPFDAGGFQLHTYGRLDILAPRLFRDRTFLPPDGLKIELASQLNLHRDEVAIFREDAFQRRADRRESQPLADDCLDRRIQATAGSFGGQRPGNTVQAGSL